MRARRPRPLGDRPPIQECLAGTMGLLVATDFDGTLSPIQADPEAPIATPENKRALRRLAAHPATVVAVVSGRALDDVRPRVGIEDIVYAGNHGLEIDRGGPTWVHPEARDCRERVRQACQAIRQARPPASGVRIEDKGLTATIHYRQAGEEARDAIEQAARDVLGASDGRLRLSPGEASLEVRPAVDWDKGSAILSLAADAPDGWACLYLGDDGTDEDAFRALEPEGIGIHIGRDPDTAAGYRLPEQSHVAPFLNALASEIHGEAIASENGAAPRPHAAEASAKRLP